MGGAEFENTKVHNKRENIDKCRNKNNPVLKTRCSLKKATS